MGIDIRDTKDLRLDELAGEIEQLSKDYHSMMMTRMQLIGSIGAEKYMGLEGEDGTSFGVGLDTVINGRFGTAGVSGVINRIKQMRNDMWQIDQMLDEEITQSHLPPAKRRTKR